ncbi:MAG: hypothetical protein ABIQ99_13450 [Thermoflexales bacterium]
MTQDQDTVERSVWLRYWREGETWRFVIEDPHTRARVAFARADDLADYLQSEPGADSSAPANKFVMPSDDKSSAK